MPILFARSEIFISPSIADAGPGTIVEAMASGLPVVSSRNCGFASLIDEGENGFTYAYNDVPHLTEILIRIAEHRMSLSEFGRRARQKAVGLSVEDYASELVDVFSRFGA